MAQGFVDRWNAKDYNGMYDLIAAADQANITRERFAARYQAIAAEAGLSEVKATLGEATPGLARFPMRVEMQSGLVGSITEDNTLTLRQEGDGWRVAWTASLIFKDLGDGLIRFKPDVPAAGVSSTARGGHSRSRGRSARSASSPARSRTRARSSTG